MDEVLSVGGVELEIVVAASRRRLCCGALEAAWLVGVLVAEDDERSVGRWVRVERVFVKEVGRRGLDVMDAGVREREGARKEAAGLVDDEESCPAE
jgi:hypothetical protein